MRINQNIASIGAQNALFTSNYGLQKSIEKLSTGLRINRASDDAAGLAVSENMRSQVRGLRMADRNAQDGISAMQIAEGSLNEVSAILQRMRELAVQASTDTLTDGDRGFINDEFQQLIEEVDRIANISQFNGQTLIDGSWINQDIQVGANNTDDDRITTAINDMTTGVTGLNIAASNVNDSGAARTAIDTLDTAIGRVNAQRSAIGSYVNRLEHTIENLKNSVLNTQAAESLIRDVDVGAEMSNFTRLQILTQAGASMLSQANMTPQSALRLFQ